jgi:predicted cupin superfamily sugar epimerase
MAPAPSCPYPYPVTNSELIRLHKLESHLEGGSFAETAVLASQPSTSAPQLPPGLAADATKALEGRAQVSWGAGAQLLGGQSAPADRTKVEATQIYYLLTSDSYRGKMHFNLHAVSRLPRP